MQNQVVSKQRVTDHGEVYTQQREVNAMLDMVKQETERIESRFLEPACGTGNFLAEVLTRKLTVVASRYRKNQTEYERYAVLAVSSIYGIDILQDNVLACRERLYGIFDEKYTGLYKKTCKKECGHAVQYILSRNIVWGDALTLKAAGDHPVPIVLSEWSPVNGGMLKRRDFAFPALIACAEFRQDPLFSNMDENHYIPEPVKEYPLVHFMKVADADAE